MGTWECENAHNYQCGAVDGVLVTCSTGRCCSQYGWCDKGNCGGGEQTEFSYNAHGACNAEVAEEVAPEIEEPIEVQEHVEVVQNATLVFPHVEVDSTWECENAHNYQCGLVDNVLVTCSTGRCCSQYGWCDKGNCGGGEQTEFSYNAHGACNAEVAEEVAPETEEPIEVQEHVGVVQNATLVFPHVEADSTWECENAHNYQCGAVDGVLVTCSTGRCCSQYGWCDKGNCG